MNNLITPEQLLKCMPRCKDAHTWANLIDSHAPLHGITSKEQLAAFIAQVGHESMDLTIMSENLNYSATGLLATFSKYFDASTAVDYQRQPQKIANRVYANRNGNGDEESGDGWKYRGSGPLQLTFTSNFKKCSAGLFADESILYDDPDKVRTDPEIGLLTALWYWDVHQLSSVEDLQRMTKIINGGLNGWDDRQTRYHIALIQLS